MDIAVVQYTTNSDAADTNLALIKDVFAQLQSAAPVNLNYAVFNLEDDTFLHIVSMPEGGDASALTQLPAFHAFQSKIDQRLMVKPTRVKAELIGVYGAFVTR